METGWKTDGNGEKQDRCKADISWKWGRNMNGNGKKRVGNEEETGRKRVLNGMENGTENGTENGKWRGNRKTKRLETGWKCDKVGLKQS